MMKNALQFSWVRSMRQIAAGGSLLLGLCLILSGTSGCGSPPQPFVWGSAHPSLRVTPPEHVLGPGDKISVFVSAQAELSAEHVVSQEGRFVQSLLGSITVSGMTTTQVQQQLRQKLSRYVSNPTVSVTLIAAQPLRVAALGEVNEPGHFLIPADESILALLARARGLTEFADDTSIYVVRKSPRTERIRFRYENLVRPDTTVTFRLRDGDSLVVE